jgi:hypothetical protein
MGRTPRELLESMDSAELSELFAYHAQMNEERELERSEAELQKFFGVAK